MSQTRTITVDRDDPDPDHIEEAAAILRMGGLVAFATETVYGLGADATNPEAIERIYEAKGRPQSNPLIIHVADVAMARRYARRWREAAQKLAVALWPGPVTLVLPKAASIPDTATAGLDTVGLRVPAPAVARALIRAADLPIAAPSANRSEHVSPTQAQHVHDDLGGRIDCILDSGPTELGIESSVIDLAGTTPRLLRPGPVEIEELERLLGESVLAPPSPTTVGAPAASPGQAARHYAPRTTCLRVEVTTDLARLAPTARDAVVLVGRAAPPGLDHVRHRFDLADPSVASRSLYATLRACDALDIERILVVLPPPEPRWRAIRDRLFRASIAPT